MSEAMKFEKLKLAANRALAFHGPTPMGTFAQKAFRDAATPAAILELVARVEALEALAKKL